MSFLSIIKQGITSPFSAIKWINSSKIGSRALTGVGVVGSAYAAHSTFGRSYGTGTTAIFAAVSATPGVGLIADAVLAAKVGLDANYKYQRSKQVSSFKSSTINDRFGTIGHMRQESHKRLIKDRNNVNRALGNEAFHFHGR